MYDHWVMVGVEALDVMVGVGALGHSGCRNIFSRYVFYFWVIVDVEALGYGGCRSIGSLFMCAYKRISPV